MYGTDLVEAAEAHEGNEAAKAAKAGGGGEADEGGAEDSRRPLPPTDHPSLAIFSSESAASTEEREDEEWADENAWGPTASRLQARNTALLALYTMRDPTSMGPGSTIVGAAMKCLTVLRSEVCPAVAGGGSTRTMTASPMG